MSRPEAHGTDLRQRVVVGARWTVAMKLLERLLGLLSTIILARLLVPDDFGIVAMAYTVIGLVDVLLDLGVHVPLIRDQNAGADKFHTAWTVRAIQSLIAGAAIYLMSAPTAAFFAEPRVEQVMAALAIVAALGGVENIGVVGFQKHLAFGMEFRFFIGKKLAGFVVAIGAAVLLESYWALVLGSFATRLAGIILSYRMHPFRPRPSMSAFGEIWSVSSWVLANNVGAYLLTRADKFFVGSRASAPILGAYAVADEVAALPTTEVLAPIGRVLFPAFSAIRDDPERLKAAFMLAFGVQCLLVLPAATGIAWVADDAVELLLGRNWAEAVPFLQILAFASLAAALSHTATYLLTSLGRLRFLAANAWLQVGVFVILVSLAVPPEDIQSIAWTRVLVGTLSTVVVLAAIWRHGVAGVGDLMRAAWRPLAATAVMSVAVWATRQVMLPPAMALLVSVACGTLAYTGAVLVFWRAAGNPNGAEAALIAEWRRLVRRA